MSRLRRAGARPLALPAIAFAPPRAWRRLDRALRRLAAYGAGRRGGYDGVIFTSANGVETFFARARRLRLARRLAHPPANVWSAAIGPATAQALRRRGWPADFVPPRYVAESLAASLPRAAVAGRRLLLPRAAVARDVAPRALRARGATVAVVPTYRTIAPPTSRAPARRLFPLRGTRPDAVLFSSSSTAHNLARLLGRDYRRRLDGVLLAAIGPITAATLRELGLEPAVTAAEFTTPALIAALREYYSQGRSSGSRFRAPSKKRGRSAPP